MKNIYAGFWRRFVASGIDYIILWFVLGIVFFGVFWNVFFTMGIISNFDSFIKEDILIFFNSKIPLIIIAFVSLILIWLYFVMFESSYKQATPGKMLLGIEVADFYGKRISFIRANIRFWGKVLSSLIFFVGFIIAGFSSRKQALHDFFSDSLLFKKSQKREYVSFKCKKCQKEAKVIKNQGVIKVQCPKCRKISVIKT